MPVSGDARSRGCSTGVLASGGMGKQRVVWASLTVTDTASRLRMRHTTPSSSTVLRLLRVGFPIPFVSQTHSRSIAPFSADLLLVHRRCTPRSPRNPLQSGCNRSGTSPIPASYWPSSPGARGRMCATRIPQRGGPTALEDPVSPGKNKSNSGA